MPPSSLDLDVTELLWRAQRSPFGIAIKVSDFVRGSAKLARVRAELADPVLAGLGFYRSPYPGELYIVHTEQLSKHQRSDEHVSETAELAQPEESQ